LDIANSAGLKTLSTKLDEVLAAQTNDKITMAVPDGLQTLSEQPPLNVQSSTPHSLTSISESLCRIERLLGSVHGSPSSAGGSALGNTSCGRRWSHRGSISSAGSINQEPKRIPKWKDQSSQYYPDDHYRRRSVDEDLSPRMPPRYIANNLGYLLPNEADQKKSVITYPPRPFGLDPVKTVYDEDDNSINPYIALSHAAAVLKSQSLILRKIPWCLPGMTTDDKASLLERITRDLAAVNSTLKELTQKCWEEGYNVDEIDHFMAAHPVGAAGANSNSDGSSSDHEINKTTNASEDEVANYNEIAMLKGQKRASAAASMTWKTKQDRINFWLLGNLQASKEEMELHRKIYREEITKLEHIARPTPKLSVMSLLHMFRGARNLSTVDEKAWSRQVLKYWLLDEAAVGLENRSSSTIGAVDSDSVRHEYRVEFQVSEGNGGSLFGEGEEEAGRVGVKDGVTSAEDWSHFRRT
jgi:hypothetical protein